MKRFRAYKTELDPTCKQVVLLRQHAGAARWTYNWGLSKKIEAYKQTGKNISIFELDKELNLLKKLPKDKGGVDWMYKSSSCAPQQSLRNLDKAYSSFFRRCKNGTKAKGFPKFKSKKNGIGSFRLNGCIHVHNSKIKLPRIGSVKLKERGYLPTANVKILSATISEAAGRWFVSLQVEEEVSKPEITNHHVIGVDVGIKVLAMTSDGISYENNKSLSKSLKLLRIRQKAISRKVKGSNNRKKAVHIVAKLHRRIVNQRKDSIHKATTAITKQASVIVIESLNVAGMIKNRKLSRSLSDASLGEFHRQIKYKSEWRGVKLIEAPRFYPSSKTCSNCSNIKETLSLDDRVYNCDKCGFKEDRDLNAALNLKNLATSYAVIACCPESTGLHTQTHMQTKLLAGQEPSQENQHADFPTSDN